MLPALSRPGQDGAPQVRASEILPLDAATAHFSHETHMQFTPFIHLFEHAHLVQ